MSEYKFDRHGSVVDMLPLKKGNKFVPPLKFEVFLYTKFTLNLTLPQVLKENVGRP